MPDPRAQLVGDPLGPRPETRLGVLGLLLLLLVGVGMRARREGLAVGAAVLLTALMVQA
ncbi:hypothetical protein AB0N37_18680 [Streptomyces griseoincarnatus]